MGNLITCCIPLLDDKENFEKQHEVKGNLPSPPLHTSLSIELKDFNPRPGLRSRENSFSDSIITEISNAVGDFSKILQHDSIDYYKELRIPIEFSKLYCLGKLLGIGTTSKVFRIFNRKRKIIDKLACKIIDKRKLTLGMSPDDVDFLLRQLQREVDILKGVSHPSIVTYYDFLETKDRIFIITEYLSGGELFDYIVNTGPLHENIARYLFADLFSAVNYLHNRGVVHRDIKAENLLFYKKLNGEFTLKLIDFGFSTILKNDLTGSFLGTGGYIAPEIRQNKNYSMSVDNWAMGVVMFCSLSGTMPFGVSVEELPRDRQQWANENFQLRFPKGSTWDRISPLCKELISQLLQIDPFKRMSARGALHHKWTMQVGNKNSQKKKMNTERPPRIPVVPSKLESNEGGSGSSTCTSSSNNTNTTEEDIDSPMRRIKWSPDVDKRDKKIGRAEGELKLLRSPFRISQSTSNLDRMKPSQTVDLSRNDEQGENRGIAATLPTMMEVKVDCDETTSLLHDCNVIGNANNNDYDLILFEEEDTYTSHESYEDRSQDRNEQALQMKFGDEEMVGVAFMPRTPSGTAMKHESWDCLESQDLILSSRNFKETSFNLSRCRFTNEKDSTGSYTWDITTHKYAGDLLYCQNRRPLFRYA